MPARRVNDDHLSRRRTERPVSASVEVAADELCRRVRLALQSPLADGTMEVAMTRPLCVVTTLLLLNLSPAAAQERGALALDERGERYALSLDGEADALSTCGTTECEIVATFSACLGVAHSSPTQGQGVWAWAEAVARPEARRDAFNQCRGVGGEACEVFADVCVDAPAAEAALGLDRAARRRIQERLEAAGFNAGGADGLFGPRTRAAIRQWQESRAAPATGYLNRLAVEALSNPDSSTPLSASTGYRTVTPATPPPATEAAPPPEAASEPAPLASPAAVATTASPAAPAGAEIDPRGPAPPATANAQLPPEIMVDRHLVRAERLLADDHREAALEAMNEVLALQDEHALVLEDDFHFRYAQVAFAAGRTERAIASLNEYLLTAGRDGGFYRQALELLDSADIRLREEERAARWSPGGVFRDCEVCPEMVVLPGGDLALGRYEVTVGEYRAFASATGGGAAAGCQAHVRLTPESSQNPGYPQTARHPVTCLSWDDAQEYVSWLSRETGASYRLPSEAEWGRAAAGSQPGCFFDRTATASTCPVGSYGSNPAGLSDMVSNLAEWTSDCWQGDCARRAIRGSAWVADSQYQIPAQRIEFLAHRRWAFIGFRVARTLE